ncbi:FKBP-type peptidyl-prolyl cis-trans isomerase FkpA precursor [alpha proteobacterium U9-1i]|nr:FKBP-type peptidyl-prolyl cis-trans isomerase FkpA precursor [alpha proteobacterium U9-1i]
MMMRIFAVAAILIIAACGDSGGVMGEIERSEKEREASAAEAAERSAEFLTETRAQAGVEARPSGLLIEFRSRGSNQSLPRPTAESTVLVHYEGKLADGSVFDSSFERGQPAQFPLNGVVPGFSEAIQQMRPGDEVIATFPAELGYGPEGQPPVIPPGAALQFRIVLLAFQGADGRIVEAPRS